MMSTLKLHTLKQKLWAIVAASFITRVLVFMTLPDTASSLAPDEITYASLTKWVGEAKPANQFPGFGEGLFLAGRSLLLPASFLYRLGLNELLAVRLVSNIYGLCGLILVVTLILKLYKGHVGGFPRKKFNEHLILGLVVVFAFLPSHFLWSNLGLRESATEFWILATFGTIFMYYHLQEQITALGILTLAASIAFTFSSRPQVGWVIGVSLVLYLVFNLKQVKTYFVLSIVFCGVLLGSVLTQGSALNTSSTGVISPSGSSGNLVGIFSPLTNAGELISSKQRGNQIDAASVIETQSCPSEAPSVVAKPPMWSDTYFCLAWRAPYMVSTFLFRPIIGLDVTSTSSLFAAAENILWVALFGTIIVLAIRRRAISFIQPILPTTIFFVLYVLGASAYQGNMGTGFRHKSLILWAVLLIIFALAWRKSEDSENSPRNISSESAV